MKTYTTEELKEILNLHAKWLANDATGSRADLSRAYLSRANLTGANLAGADLTGANLSRADLSRAYLSRANLAGADLTGAYLAGADLTGANLTGAYLTGAYLAGADGEMEPILKTAAVRFSDHGECGRELLAIMTDKSIHLCCGCWSGSPAELKKYIADGNADYRKSRRLALKCVLMLLGKQNTEKKAKP